MQQTFTTRFNYRFYFGLLLYIPFIGMVAAGLDKLIENIGTGTPFSEAGFTIIMPAICLAFMGYIVQFMISHSPKVSVNEEQLYIGKAGIALHEIDSIDLQAFHDTYFFFFYYQEIATTITLKNGRKYTLFAGHYLNGSLLRLNLASLSDYLKGKTGSFSAIMQHKEKQTQQFSTESYVEYRQSPYTSFNYYLLGSFSLFGFGAALYLPLSGIAPWIVSLIPMIGSSLFLFMLAVQSHYFLLAEDHILIRNYLLPWKKRTFAISDIYSAVTECIANQETSLRITTNDFKVYRYQSCLLDDALFEHLIISIQNKQKAIRTKAVFQ
ncbi:hypothetical protein I0P70_05305 [Pontibacter sp. FD36]|uniref:hypothetical protein n=1 Tax=Pontibacter sp. FD36 TaxID=2789860 RepID=UPI0018AA55C7|nr:hypothetical protein [Pontibacter sp. FD36]MBF8962657.1 hypothetical protein [Pontibacter sp. FD36]